MPTTSITTSSESGQPHDVPIPARGVLKRWIKWRGVVPT